MKTPLVLFLISLCSTAIGGELEALYLKQVGNKEHSVTNNPATSGQHGISEIGIEHTPCYGTCPVYTLIIRSDGTVRYNGEKFVERVGKLSGKIEEKWRFDQLAQFIMDSNFMGLADCYTTPITDGPTVYTMVVLNGKRKVVSNYHNTGPSKLWAIEHLIDDLMRQTKWDKER